MKLELGHLRGEPGAVVAVSPSAMFGRHCGIIGATGGGKSWTVARVVEQCARFRCKMILFDPSGEYGTLEGGVAHVRVGEDPSGAGNAYEVTVPYTDLFESDLYAIFRPNGPIQAVKLRAAMRSLKLAAVAPMLATGGTVMKAHRAKLDYEREYQRHYETVEGMLNRFDIRNLIAQIQNECVDHQRSAVESSVWGGPNGLEQSQCVPLMSRIQEILHAANLAPIFNPGPYPSLFEVFERFFEDESTRVLCVSLAGLSFQHNTRQIVTNAVGRYLLEHARAGRFLSRPLVVVLDEAHQFLLKDEVLAREDFPLNSFAFIAKEGRKYALTMCLATQRPRDIPEDVLSQCGTMLIHRITNDIDRMTVERAVGALSAAESNVLPTLKTGEALLVGSDVQKPLFLTVSPPDQKPLSDGPDYERFWG